VRRKALMTLGWIIEPFGNQNDSGAILSNRAGILRAF
jgi:hypothetical protein